MTRARIAKYAAFSRISLAQARRERGELYGRVVFFFVILGVFSSLWKAVAEAGRPVAIDPKALVWYLAATEWILLSMPRIHLDIQEDIRRGDVVYRLGHPVSYVMAEDDSGYQAPDRQAAGKGTRCHGAARQDQRRRPTQHKWKRRQDRSLLCQIGIEAERQHQASKGKVETIARQLWEFLITFSVYPEPLFGGMVRVMLFTVLPAGFVGYIPTRLVLTPSFLDVVLLWTAAGAYLGLAVPVFQRGLRRYASGSRFATFGW